MYKVTESNPKIQKELDIWFDVCFTMSMAGFGNLGGYVADEVPERFQELALAYKEHVIDSQEGVTMILEQLQENTNEQNH